MATYLIKREKPLTRQEGDFPAPIQFTVPGPDPGIDMSLFDLEFKVVDNSRRTVFHKKSADGDLTIDGQLVTIPLTETDTKRKPGKHKWEAQIKNGTTELITIGRGPFTIIPEGIK
jgi:hypothetical protein